MEHFLSGTVYYVISFLAVISVVVFVHEFGHYWVARRCGIKIETFSIGFGQEIFGWTDKHGTRWKVSWLPLGGYVKMYGDANVASTPGAEVQEMTEEQKKVSFFHQHVDKRMAVIVAGPASNYIFAILVLAVLFMFQGQAVTKPIISEVANGSSAAMAGIKAGDQVTAIDGRPIQKFEDIVEIVSMNVGTPLSMNIERGGKPLTVSVTPVIAKTNVLGTEFKVGRIGIKSNQVEYIKRSPPAAVYQATLEAWRLSVISLKSIGQMILGLRDSDEIGGPLRIAEMSGNIAKQNPATLILFIAQISISLGFINLFPIPLLDGGHLAFYLAERLRGRPLSLRIQEAGANCGLVFVGTLMLFATWNDLVHLKVISYLTKLFS